MRCPPCAHVLRQRGLPPQVRKGTGQFAPVANTIKGLTMHASKGLEFPVVAQVGVGRMLTPGRGGASACCTWGLRGRRNGW